MQKAVLRFYSTLNYLLPKDRRNADFEVEFKGKRSVKDMIESLGVPHTEVDIILVNGRSVDFNYILREGDKISVYPAFEKPDIEDLVHLCSTFPSHTKFIADINLGDIVKYMRVLGFDVYFDPSLSPREIIKYAKRYGRTIITKSRKLLKFREIDNGLLLYAGTTEEQIRGIISRLGLKRSVKPFSRCLRCNKVLVNIAKEKIEDRIPPKTRSFCDRYAYCKDCNRIYWEGTHVFEMRKLINRILGAPERPEGTNGKTE